LFGQYVYQELALVIAPSIEVTTFGLGAAGILSSAADTTAPSNKPLAEAVAQNGGDDAAVLTACENLRILAACRHDPPIASEDAFVHTRLLREHLVPHVELADAEARAHLCADVAADTLADAAEVECTGRLRDLLRLAVDVVDDVVGADENAGAALAAAAERHHLVHHLLEARMIDHRADSSRGPFAVSIGARPGG
jgi:hypothetical protein